MSSTKKKTGVRLTPSQAASIASLLSKRIKALEEGIFNSNKRKVDELAALAIRKYRLTTVLTVTQKFPPKSQVTINLAELATYRNEVELTPTSKLKDLQDDVRNIVTTVLEDSFAHISNEEVKNMLIRDSIMNPFSSDLETEVVNFYQAQKVAEFKTAVEQLHKKLK